MIGIVITAGYGAIFAAGVALVIWALRDERNPGPMFTTEPTVPGPGRCGCGAPKCTPEPKPFPGDEPRQPAPGPVPVPGYVAEAIGHDGDADAYLDSAYTKAHARLVAAGVLDG